MKLLTNNIFLAITIVLFTATIGFSQSLRGLVNDGVEHYNEKNYPDAEVNFKKGTDKEPGNFEAKFNLGDALFKQERYDEAINTYQSAMPIARNDMEKARVLYNIGNSLLKSQKIKESIEQYKESLKINPSDQEAKYNLSYALEMLKNQNEQKQDKQDQNQNKDKNQDKNKNQNQQKQDQQKQQQQQQQQNQNEQTKQDNTKQQQQQPQKISKEEAERILEALKDNEKDLQKELRKIKGKRVKTDKDW